MDGIPWLVMLWIEDGQKKAINLDDIVSLVKLSYFDFTDRSEMPEYIRVT